VSRAWRALVRFFKRLLGRCDRPKCWAPGVPYYEDPNLAGLPATVDEIMAAKPTLRSLVCVRHIQDELDAATAKAKTRRRTL
jgi:hypothetical protein